jgi:PAS domain S-box-containing protein
MLTTASPQLGACLALTRAIGRARCVDEIHAAALAALEDGLGVTRSSILLFDQAGVMRFVAWRGLSESYRRAVEGHTPWTPGMPDAEPLVVSDVREDASLVTYLPVFEAEGIRALAFIPLVSAGGVIGKFMLYETAPRVFGEEELQLAALMASQVAFAVERTTAELKVRRSEERLRFALDAASMGTWEWDLVSNHVEWSENLARLHGLPPGTFDGTFASYEREIHPDDRERVLSSAQRALTEGVPHDVEYRIVAPDGSVRWVEGKGDVEYDGDRPVRMSGVCIMATRRKEAELARLASAEEASRTKDEFLATLSHELRTPLNAILGWVQLLQAGGLPEARAAQAVDIIGRNARLQARLIEDILDVSRIITGKLELERLPVSLPQVFDTVLSGIAPAAEAKGVRLDTRVDQQVPLLEGDPKRLQQVLGNVLSNAVKFTPAGGHVECRCVAAPDRVTIEVQDTGVGVDPEFLPHMFQRFRQADSRSTRQHGGLGLGLAIARHLVELHGGEISAVSEGPGLGTLVRIALPVAPAVSRPVAAAPGASGTDRSTSLEGVSVLVVDDARDSRDLIVAVVESAGGHARVCDSAAAALDTLASAPVDLIIADIAMPHVDGCTLMAEVRRRHHDVAAIAVSALARLVDRRRAMSSGFDAYHTKPVDAARLLDEARNLLGTRRRLGPCAERAAGGRR